MSDLFHYHIPRAVKHETPKTKKNEREREREALIAHENASAWLAMGEKYSLDNNIIHGLRLFCSSLPLALSSAYLRIFKEKE